MNIEVALKTINGKEVPAVTSLQVAEAFGKEHKNVLADIRNTSSKCSESFNALNFQLVDYKDAKGETRPMYLLSKDGLMMVTMGYITPEAMRVKEAYIARFNEMEARLSGGYALPRIPQSFPDALRMIADIEEEKALAIEQRNYYRRTKAEIGSRREATAMNTASRLSKENARLHDALGDGRTWKQAKAIEWIADYFIPSPGMWSQLGKKLSALSAEMGYAVKRKESSEYPNGVGLYHASVITRLRARLDAYPEMLGKYRRSGVCPEATA
jgi:Rha family phage regulatory protein